MGTIKDVARLAGVSPSTVSGVLNQRINVRPETYQKIMQAIEKTEYRANAVARGLRMKETRTLGLVLPTITNPHYPQIARGVEDYANQNDYHVFLCNTERNPEKQRQYVHALANKGIDGIILYNTQADAEDFKFLKSHSIACATNYPVKAGWVDEVRINHREAARNMISYLFTLGHRRIALINGHATQIRCRERLAGVRAAYREADFELDESLIFHGDFSQEFAYGCARTLLDRRRPPTCVFTTDHMAVAVLNTAFERGLRVPEDLSVAGFDQAVATFPSLTTMHNSSYEVGLLLAEMAITRRRSPEPPGKRTVVVPSDLVVGKSTCAAPPGKSQD